MGGGDLSVNEKQSSFTKANKQHRLTTKSPPTNKTGADHENFTKAFGKSKVSPTSGAGQVNLPKDIHIREADDRSHYNASSDDDSKVSGG